MKLNLLSLSSILLMSTILVACGGGESSSNKSVDATPLSDTGDVGNQQDDVPVLLTKQFIAALHYTTESQSGITTSDGEFSFLAGETVNFYLGEYKLPSVSGARLFTPLGYVPNGFSDNHPAVINLTRLLQSLDVDLEPSNGIQLPESLNQSVNPETAETLGITHPSELFERLDIVLELLSKNNVTELINMNVAIAAFQSELDRIESEFIIAAAGDNTLIEGGCTDVRNGFVSPFPCIPGTGGFAVGNLKVESIVGGALFLPVNGGRRRDTIVGGNYLSDMHQLASIFENQFEITDFADSLNVGIVLFTTTDKNPFRDNVISGGGWDHTELFLESSYIGELPYTRNSNLQSVIDRCGLNPELAAHQVSTRRIILSPGTYSWNANAYESYGCRSGFYCPSVAPSSQQTIGDVIVSSGGGYKHIDEELVEKGQIPIWEWSGSFEVQSGECTVVHAQGSETIVNETPEPQGDVTDLYGHYYNYDWDDYTFYDFDGSPTDKFCTEYILDESYPDNIVRELYIEVQDGYLIEGLCPITDIATYACHGTYWGGGVTDYTWKKSGSTSEIAREACEGVFEVF
jgi:hypothetical protein